MTVFARFSFGRFQVATAVLLSLFLVLAAPRARAQDGDPAASQIQTFQSSLLETMKQGSTLGAKGRFHKITPAVQKAFNLQAMTAFAVGPSWSGLSAAQHTALVDAFTRLTAASYAHNFSSYAGEKFTVDSKVETRGPDKLVQGHIIATQGAPVSLVYRMRDTGGTWKVIDVYFQGSISQLTTRRSDFAAAMASGGEPALLAQLNGQIDKLLQ
jgi:phospholipid transport system substrate-binding protein